MSMTKVVIADAHPITRLAVRMLLEQEKYTIVGEADNGIDTIELAKKLKPDVIILEIEIKKIDGLEVIARLSLSGIKSKILILTGRSDLIYSGRCMRAGVAGFVSKENNLPCLTETVKTILDGFKYFPDIPLHSNLESPENAGEYELIQSLSNREIATLRCLANGLKNKDIADTLLISEKTVSTYKMRLMQKLNARNLIELFEFYNGKF
jgi:two-component system response regulator EvgA